MTENEALKLGKSLYENITSNANNIIPTKEYIEFVGMGIKALEELQSYRAIGTVEELKAAMKYMQIAKMHGTVGKAIDACAEYEAIGTIEEFKALKEKSVERKANDIENVIPYGTKIIYHGEKGWKNCQCYCGHYNKEDDTYNIYNVWDLCHVPKEYIEIFDWSE